VVIDGGEGGEEEPGKGRRASEDLENSDIDGDLAGQFDREALQPRHALYQGTQLASEVTFGPAYRRERLHARRGGSRRARKDETDASDEEGEVLAVLAGKDVPKPPNIVAVAAQEEVRPLRLVEVQVEVLQRPLSRLENASDATRTRHQSARVAARQARSTPGRYAGHCSA
jgi:hypothetical protein